MNVADLAVDGRDALGSTIVDIYARKPPEFAVYRTPARVWVHFADDPKMSGEQRKAIAQLAPVRGEIAGLVDGWRSAPDSKSFLFLKFDNGAKLRFKAERYDRRVADAIHVALEGDVSTANLLLNRVKEDILSERVGWSRFEYLMTAFTTVIGICLISAVVMLLDFNSCASGRSRVFCVQHAHDLWHGFAGGAAGAFFSIALAIRGRTILTDLYRTSNLMDAVLRVVVGAIGGVVLVALLLTGFVRFHLGDPGADSSPDVYGRMHILIVSFIAGFAERLVPDLLAKADVRTGERPIARQAEPIPPPLNIKERDGDDDGDAAQQPFGVDEQESDPGQSAEDGCVVDHELTDEEVTRDEDLPRASGGVATEGQMS